MATRHGAPRQRRESAPRASARSSAADAPRRRGSSASALRADERRELAEDPLTSSRSATSASRSRFESSTAASGSTKSVCPEPDESCTIPGTRPRADAFSASTGRPPRSVTKSSCRCSAQRGVARELAEPLGELAAALAQLAPQAAQRRRGRVAQVRAVFLDRAADLLGDATRATRRCRRRAPSAPAGRPGRRAPGARRRRRRDRSRRPATRPARVERAAALGEVGRLAHVGGPAEIRLGRLVEERDRLGVCRCRSRTTRRPATGRAPPPARRRLARRRGGEPREDGGELEQLEIVLAHAVECRADRGVGPAARSA